MRHLAISLVFLILTFSYSSYAFLTFDEAKFVDNNKNVMVMVENPYKEISFDDKMAFVKDTKGDVELKKEISKIIDFEKTLDDKNEVEKILKEKQRIFKESKQNKLSSLKRQGVFLLAIAFIFFGLFVGIIKCIYEDGI